MWYESALVNREMCLTRVLGWMPDFERGQRSSSTTMVADIPAKDFVASWPE
jgi:hypothetical protein